MTLRLSTHTGLIATARLALLLVALLSLAFVLGAPGSDPIMPPF